LHEYCPLCHRLILPTKIKTARHTDSHTIESESESESENATLSTQAIAFMA
jgi:hypothetical protein